LCQEIKSYSKKTSSGKGKECYGKEKKNLTAGKKLFCKNIKKKLLVENMSDCA